MLHSYIALDLSVPSSHQLPISHPQNKTAAPYSCHA